MTNSKTEQCLKCLHYGANVRATVSRWAWRRIAKKDRTQESSCSHPVSYTQGNGRYMSAEAMRSFDCGWQAKLFSALRSTAELVERSVLVRHIVWPTAEDGEAHGNRGIVVVEVDGHQGSIGVPMSIDQIGQLTAVAGRRLQARVGVAPSGALVFEDWTSQPSRETPSRETASTASD